MQLEFFDVPSPCIGVCQSDLKGYCLGCMRTRDERKTWTHLDCDNKQKVIKRCIQRKKRQQSKMAVTVVDQKLIEENHQQPAQPSLLDPPDNRRLSDDMDLDFGDFDL